MLVEDGVEADFLKRNQKKCSSQLKREVPLEGIEVGEDGIPMIGMLTVEEYKEAPEEIIEANRTFSPESFSKIMEWRLEKYKKEIDPLHNSGTREEEERREEVNGESMEITPNHYNVVFQPVDYIHANNLDFFEGNVIKYVTRHRYKNGAEDIRKAIHYLKMILEKDYGEQF